MVVNIHKRIIKIFDSTPLFRLPLGATLHPAALDSIPKHNIYNV